MPVPTDGNDDGANGAIVPLNKEGEFKNKEPAHLARFPQWNISSDTHGVQFAH